MIVEKSYHGMGMPTAILTGKGIVSTACQNSLESDELFGNWRPQIGGMNGHLSWHPTDNAPECGYWMAKGFDEPLMPSQTRLARRLIVVL